MSMNPLRPLVHAVVLNWNGAEEAIGCLRSLETQTYPNIHPIVVDNGSVDDSIAQIRAAFPDIDLLQNAENKGFAGGVNVGMQHALEAGAKYVVVLNNDLVLDAECIEQMVLPAEEGAAFVTAVIYYTDDPQRIWSIGGNINRWNLEKTADARGQLDNGQFPAVIERHFVPGGATLMSCASLKEIGLFDEGFFLYYEDADLSLRAHRLGYKMAVATKARMWHAVSRSSGGSDSPRERYWMARSSVRYFRKHVAVWQWPIVSFWRTGSAMRTTGRLLRAGKREALASYWRGLWHGLRDRL